MALARGSHLGPYGILSALGAGGMGEVYLAEDTRLGRRVAIKLLAPDLTRNPESVRRFIQEARAASALNHPNIVTVHDVGECEDGQFLVMEMVEGQTLRSIASVPQPWSNLVPLFDQMVKAIEAAHAAGITHRDLKPENIMVRGDGYVKILDFGLARLSSLQGEDATMINATLPGQVMGTVRYMSPEQARGEAVSSASDIFSLGVVFYELVADRHPFKADSNIGFFHAINTQMPAPLTDVPDALAGVITSMLRKDACERPSARAVSEALAAVARADARGSQTAVMPSRSSAAIEQFWVAVLPFQFRGQDPALRHVAESLSEDIIAGLSRFSYLRVLAHGLTAKFAAEATDTRSIGKQLGARYVLEGSLRQTGASCRLAVRLAESASGTQLWAETYDRRLNGDDLFAMQDEWVAFIVARVADQHGVLVHDMSGGIRNKLPHELTAHEAVLSVFGFHERMSPDEHARVRAILERLVRESPDSSDCWAMLATVYSDEHMFGFHGEPDSLGRAQAAAQRAVQLSPASALSCQAMAQSLFFRKEWKSFRPYAERTIALNPLDSATCAFIGLLLGLSGAWESGGQAVESAIRNNPNHPGWYWLGLVFHAFHKQDFRAVIDLASRVNMPGYFWGPAMLASAYGHLDEFEAARKQLRDLLAIRPDFATTARHEFEKWFALDLAGSVMDGLEKAGLPIAGSSAPISPDRSSSDADAGFWIAVTPFKFAGSGLELGSLADGLTEEITTGLTRFSYLRVIGGESRKARRARYVLDGNVRLSAATVRLTCQLTDSTTGTQLWAETYTRAFRADAMFELQDDLAARIVTSLADAYGALPRSMSQAVRGKPIETLTPYEALLRSFTYAERVSLEEHAAATKALERAVEQAPDSSDCWAMLAMLRTDGFIHGFDTAEGGLDRALTAARTAVDKGQSNHKAHQALAWTLCFRKEHSAALAAADRTIALNPLDACAKVYMGQVMVSAGAWDRGVALVRDALPLNPNHPGWYWYPLYCDAYRRGDYRGALDHALQMNMPDFPLTHVALAAAYGQLGEQGSGAKAIRDLLALRPDFPSVARQELGKIWDESLTAALIDGLRKAGLETASPSPDSSATRAIEGFWVAVLPFKSALGNADVAALAEGLSEEIVAGLSRFSTLRVIARASTLRFAQETPDLRIAGKQLGARYVMTGNLRLAGSRLRITVQLGDAVTGVQLWTETYERAFAPETVFDIQDDLVPRIVSTVADWYGVLPHSLSEAVRLKPLDRLTPYEALLRSFGYYERVVPAEHALARSALERAVQESPANAEIWAMLSMLYGEEHRFGFNAEPDPLGRSLDAARRAIAVAPSSHSAHLAMAQALFFRREFDAFRHEAERALALNPMDGASMEYLGHLLAFAGDWERGCDLAERARQLNPHHPAWYWALPFLDAYRKTDYVSARILMLKSDMPGQFFSRSLGAAVLGQLGERAAAADCLREVLALKPDFRRIVRDEYGKWYRPDLVEHLIDGLRKAGLEITDEAPPPPTS